MDDVSLADSADSAPSADTSSAETSPADTSPADTSPADADGGDVFTGDVSVSACNAHTGDVCDMVRQNCADILATCTYDSSAKHTVCTRITMGTKLRGESCSMQADCDKGLFCHGGKCSPPCCDSSVCGSGGSCSVSVMDGTATAYSLCSY